LLSIKNKAIVAFDWAKVSWTGSLLALIAISKPTVLSQTRIFGRDISRE
jgi:hypothetical protein